MKAIIYAGIGLFSVASIYGVADYYNTRQKGTMDKLYKEDDVQEVIEKEVTNPTAAASVIAVKGNAVVNSTVSEEKPLSGFVKKFRQPRRTIRLEDFSRGRIAPMPELSVDVKPLEELTLQKEEPRIAEPATDVVSPAVSIKEPERKLSLDQFSRAPLRTPRLKLKAVSFLKKEKPVKE